MDIERDERRMEHVESLRGVLQDILTVDLMPNETDFLEIYGRVCLFVNPLFFIFFMEICCLLKLIEFTQ